MKLDDIPDKRVRAMTVAREGCWVWTGSTNEGYGQILRRKGHGGRQVKTYAHRYAYEAFVGPIPKDASVVHTCRRRACLYPRHLTLKR